MLDKSDLDLRYLLEKLLKFQPTIFAVTCALRM